LKLPAAGCRSGGRAEAGVSRRRDPAGPVVRRPVRGHGGREARILEGTPRPARAARRGARAGEGGRKWGV